MRDLFTASDPYYDAGFDSTFWRANLYVVAAKSALTRPETPGYGRRVGSPVWENADFWRAALPLWRPGTDVNRFMRLLQALEIPQPAAF